MCLCPLCHNFETTLLLHDQAAGFKRRDWACPVCGLVFLEPSLRLGPEEEKARYDHHTNHPGEAGYLDFLRRLGDPLRRYLKPGSRGLDFGCGPGPAMEVVLGLSGAEVSRYDYFYYPDQSLLEKTYDFITATEVVEHLFDPQREFRLLSSLLRPGGGVLAIMTEILESETDFAGWWYRKDPTHVCFYRKETFEWIAGNLGLRCEFERKNIIFLVKPKPEDPISFPVP